jgi:hypothetical protein
MKKFFKKMWVMDSFKIGERGDFMQVKKVKQKNLLYIL